MRIFFTILFFIPVFVNATNYYVDTSGNNSNNGLTTGTAWKTISKVNSFSLSTGFLPGDSVLLKCGQTWVDTLRIHSAGTLASPIIFSSYGTGNKPIISAFYQVPNAAWTDSSHIWRATVSNSVPQLNTVMIDGKLRAKGRYPNTGFMATSGFALTQWKVYNYGTPHLSKDYSGGQLVFLEFSFILDNPFIDSTKGTGDTMYLRTPLTYNINNAGYYFIENTPKVLDTTYEWAFDSTAKKLYVYSLDTPNVQISIFDTSVISRRKDYVTFNNLHITGSNAVGICADTSNHITITYCVVNDTGGWYTDYTKFGGGAGGAAIRGQAAIGLKIQNDSLVRNLNNGLFAIHGCDSATITNNYIDSSAVMTGMGSGGNGAYMGIYAMGNSDTITNNTVLRTGYSSIYYYGLKNYLYRNYVDTFDLAKEDGGGIYTASCVCTGTIVRSNISKNGIGTFGNKSSAPLYNDNGSSGITYDSNGVYGGRGDDILVNGGTGLSFTNNIVYASNGRGIYFSPFNALNNTTVKYNIFNSTTHFYPVDYFGARNGGGNSNIVSDSNYVFRSFGLDSLFASGLGPTYYSLPAFQLNSGFELHSSLLPTNYSNGSFYSNNTLSDIILTFSSHKVDAKGTVYFTGQSITIHPFQSIILFDFPSSEKKHIGTLIFN